MDFLQKNIDSRLYSAYQSAFLKNGSLTCESSGTFNFDSDEKINDSTQFDLASLTKAILTVPLFYSLISLKEVSAGEEISRFFGDSGKDITLYELLSHTSGFPAWLPFYKLVSAGKTSEERKSVAEKIIFEHKTSEKTKCYSDLNYLLLGFILEKIFGQPLDLVFENFKENNMLRSGITFHPQNRTPETAFSEMRNAFPEKSVEDENSYFLGGITAHAGLFGSASEIVNYFDNLLKTQWFMPVAEELDFAGFDRSEGNDSNYGKSANPKSFGHLGFTGTAFLIDPDKKIIASLLTNSTHPAPDKPERKERIKRVRQIFFDEVAL